MKKYSTLFLFILCMTFFISCNSEPDTNSNDDDTKVVTITKEDGKTYTMYTFTPATTYQTVDGIGAGFTYYTGWVNYQSSSVQSAEFDTLFSDAKIPILRFMCKYEYTTDNVDEELATMQKFYTAAKSQLPSGESPIVLMCCWSPKASLKSNGNTAAKKDSSGNAISSSADYGTLEKDNDGNYEYDAYAAWWAEAVKYYETNGILISYVSIQNEVDWPTTYESCLFSATESGGYASYAKAFVAV